MDRETFKISQGERRSALWGRLAEEIERLIELYRLRLERDQPEYESAKLRGRIAELREILAFGKEDNRVSEE